MNDEGQLYTIEGIAAAALILTTVYLVLNSTMVFTPGDTHVYDMQLEQLGNDVLAVMDQPTYVGYHEQSLSQRARLKSILKIMINADFTEIFVNTAPLQQERE